MDRPGNNVKAIFIAALDHEPGADRAAYLDAACGDNADLRRRVEALLAAHERADEVLGPAGEPSGESVTIDSNAGRPRDEHRSHERQIRVFMSQASITADYQATAGPDVLDRRSLHAATEDRRRRHGRGLGRQADRAGQAQSRAEADQDRHGFAGPCWRGSSRNARPWR